MGSLLTVGGEAFGSAPQPHRLDEFAASYSLAGCTPALPASALPAGSIFIPPAETVNLHHRKVGDFSTGTLGNFQLVLTQNTEGQRTLLRYARQTREKLPIADVSKLLGSNDSGVARAADKYLETEDSPEARRLYLTRHKGEALILGLRSNEDPGHFSFTAFDELEDQLRKQVKGEKGVEIYGLLTAGYWGNAGQILVRKSVRAAELRFIEDPARYYSRSLSHVELSELE
jgi:hypothetical protein